VDGVIQLGNTAVNRGDARWLRVAKLRGSTYLHGHHGFAIGDDGIVVLPRLEAEIEGWAESLGRDSAVTVLFLGDNIYPLGLHPPGSPEFPRDSSVLVDQVRLLSGPKARKRKAQGYFVAGNHDWGMKDDFEGFQRLKHLDDLLGRVRAATGAGVRLVPNAGTGGPFVVDLGESIRLTILDTAWWLLAGGAAHADHAVVLDSVEAALRTARERHVVMVAHHPLRTAGPHGGDVSFWRTVGVQYLLVRSGAILQDIGSIPYRDLEHGLRAIFSRTRAPFAFVAGHDHSLQVFRALEPTDPHFTLVSGSASKLSRVNAANGLVFGRSAPGYMRLVVEKSGGITLFVDAAPEGFLSCPARGAARSACMTAGVSAFRTVYSQRLR
ncbi:MAG: hypothetical protein KY464_11110, partial [Gemmatimonadetes bacterium]|nr:hypothetical protein [Gemmatimonadota bacterium]